MAKKAQGKKRRAKADELPVRVMTVPKMAARLNVPVHRVRYILQTRPDIRPRVLEGKTRLYDETAVAKVATELNRTGRRGKSGRKGAGGDGQ